MDDLEHRMRSVCSRYGAVFSPVADDDIVGVADNVGSDLWPLNGLRHDLNGASGWFMWAGETLSQAPTFFKPTHAEHLRQRCPQVMPFLGLGPGWRFLIAPAHEDVWHDETLLNIDVPR